MNERDGKRVLIIGGAVLLGIAVVNNAYQAGLSAGLVGSGRVTGVARVHGYDGFGIFPPFPLIVIGLFLFLAWRRGWIGGGPRNGNGHGNGPDRGFGSRPPRFFEEWHRRAHEAEAAPAAPAVTVPGAGAGQAPSGQPGAGYRPAGAGSSGTGTGAAPGTVGGGEATTV